MIAEVNESLDDLEKASAILPATPKVAEVIAIAFDLSRLKNTLAGAGILMTSLRLVPPRAATSVASPALRVNAERWDQIAKDVAKEVQPYSDGWDSYTFHLGQAIDDAFTK
jgi:hypothetical protein